MAEDIQKDIILSVKIDTTDAVAGVDALQTELKNVAQTPLDKPFKNFKAQIKEATMEAQKLEQQFGRNSEQFRNAAQNLANLKDANDEFGQSIKSFNPDNKLQSLVSASQGAIGALQGVTGAMAFLGVESGSATESIAKLQGLMAFSQSLNSIDDIKNGFKDLKRVAVDAFEGIKKAIGSTGIGLLVIALGAIYAYWDDIKAAVTGVNEEQKKLNETAKENQKLAKDRLEDVSLEINALKLKGATEKDILKYKILQTQEALKTTIAVIESDNITAELAERATKRNYDLVISFLEVVQAPFKFIVKNLTYGINLLIDGLNLLRTEKLPKLDITPYLNTVNDFLAAKLFNPEDAINDRNAAVEENNKTIKTLTSQIDGYNLEIIGLDKKAVDDKKAIATKAGEDILAANKKLQEQIRNLKEKNALDLIKDEEKNALENLKNIYKRAQEEINASIGSKTLKNEALKQLEIQYNNDILTTEQEYFDKSFILLNKANQDKADVGNKQREKEFNTKQDSLNEQAKLDLATANDSTLGFKDRLAAVADREQKEKDIVFASQAERTAYEKANADARIKIGEEESAAKEKQLQQIGSALSTLSELAGKQTVAGKALAIASATISTYQNAVSAYSAAFKPVATQFSPVLGAVYAGIAVAQGVVNVKKILAVPVPGGGGGGGGSSPSPSAIPSALSAPSIVASATAPQAIQDVRVTNQGQAPIRAYITDRDLRSNEQRTNFLNNVSTF